MMRFIVLFGLLKDEFYFTVTVGGGGAVDGYTGGKVGIGNGHFDLADAAVNIVLPAA